jgi:hypothetical protein
MNSAWSHRALASLLTSSLLSASLLALCAPSAHAQSSADPLADTALALAPADAAFFGTNLNLGQIWERQLTSGLVAELRQVPYVQELEAYLLQQYNSAVRENPQVRSYVEGPIVQDLLALIKDMVSHEVFVIGDSQWPEFLAQLSEFQGELVAINPESPEDFLAILLAFEKEDMDAIHVPTTVVGFKLSDDTSARNYLDLLEGVARGVLSSTEELQPLAEALKRRDFRSGQLLTLELRGADVPWDSIPVESDEQQDLLDHLQSLIEDRSLFISMGVVNNRGMFSISEDPKLLENLGKGETLLQNENIRQVFAKPPKDLRGIQYYSGAWRQVAVQMSYANYFENLANQMSVGLLIIESEEADALREQLIEDAIWLDEQVAALTPEYAAALSFSFLSEAGLESYAYDWTPATLLENAKPLAIAAHAGKNPLVVLASRQRWSPGMHEMIEAALDQLPKYLELAEAAELLDEDQEDIAQVLKDEALPILRDLHATLKNEIQPALDGYETLTAMATQWTLTQLSPELPPADEALPVLEVAVAVKLKDKDQFLSGLESGVNQLNEVLDLLREHVPDFPAALQIPMPADEPVAKGTRFFYPLGAEPPFDQAELQMMVSDSVAVFGYSTRQVRDMFEARPLATRPAWYKPADSAAAVSYLDFAGMVASVRPWIRYALQTAVGDLEQPLGAAGDDVPVPTGADILEIWDCFRKLGKAAGTTVVNDDGVTVSRWIWTAE